MTDHLEFARLKKACIAFIDRSRLEPAAETESAFKELALDLFRYQFTYNLPYRLYCQSRKATPETVRSWEEIPPLITTAWKEFELSILPPEERERVFYSSGTTTQKRGRHFHSRATLEVYEKSLLRWFKLRLLPEVESTRFLFLSPPPSEAPHSSLVHMFETVQREFGTEQSRFAASSTTDGAWQLDFDAIESFVADLKEQDHPVILGTAFSFVHLCDHLAENNRSWRLPQGTRVMETGGYKGRSRELAKKELHQFISARLGMPEQGIICEYGMSELSSQAYDSPAEDASRIFRFPPWARPRIVSPETGQAVEPGATGLLQVFDLANIGSVMAVQTEDLARQTANGFELIGRSASAEPRGCSLMNL
ncbi:MAG: long-chain fatty acid--CoA ligase [Verrucomicrobiales bacterium]